MADIEDIDYLIRLFYTQPPSREESAALRLRADVLIDFQRSCHGPQPAPPPKAN